MRAARPADSRDPGDPLPALPRRADRGRIPGDLAGFPRAAPSVEVSYRLLAGPWGRFSPGYATDADRYPDSVRSVSGPGSPVARIPRDCEIGRTDLSEGHRVYASTL